MAVSGRSMWSGPFQFGNHVEARNPASRGEDGEEDSLFSSLLCTCQDKSTESLASGVEARCSAFSYQSMAGRRQCR